MFCELSQSTCGQPKRSAKMQSSCEALEPRTLLSTINWVNRLFDDDFSVYGANETVVRGIIDRTIGDWERVISNFNFSDHTNTYNLTVRAQSGPPGAGSATMIDNDGKPHGGTLTLDDFGGGGQPWYFDSTPGTSMVPDDAEFDLLVSPFNGDDGPGPGLDFYMVALHEIGHALGISTSQPTAAHPLAVNQYIDYDAWVIDPNNPGDGCAPNDPGCVDPGNHLFPVNFNGGPVDYTMTDAGGPDHPFTIPSHLYEGPAVGGLPTHPNDLLNDGRTASGNLDQRRLISDTDASFLRDIYGYSVVMPSQINTFYANFNTTTGALHVEGDPGNANDFITIDTIGSDVRVQVNGTTERVPAAMVSLITIVPGGGDDTVNIYALPVGIGVSIGTSAGNDTINIGNGDLDSTIFGAVTVSAGVGNDALRLFDQNDTGNDSYTVTNSAVTKPGTLFGGLFYSFDVESLVVTGNEFDNTVNVESLSSNTTLTLNGRGGDDTFIVGGQAASIGGVITGHVAINGGTFGADRVIFDDSAGSGQDIYLLNGGNYQQTDSQVLTFSDIEQVEACALTTTTTASPSPIPLAIR